MAFTHGKDSIFKIDNSAGSLVAITDYLDSVEFERNPDQLDVTTFGDVDKEFLSGFQDSSLNLGGLQDFADDAVYDIVATAVGSATTRSWEYFPEGDASGKIKYSGELVVLGYSAPVTVDAPARWTASCRIDGAVTRTTI